MKESNFKFSNPIVETMEYSISNKFDSSKPPSVTNQFDIKIGKSETLKEAIVRLTILIDANQENTNSPFSILLTIGAKFVWDDSYDNDTINSMLSINAPALLLGYARPIVSLITSSCPSGSYNLPFYNFAK